MYKYYFIAEHDTGNYGIGRTFELLSHAMLHYWPENFTRYLVGTYYAHKRNF